MSGPEQPGSPEAGPDPSMEDILASIRRILNEDEAPPGQAPASMSPAPASPAPPPPQDDVLVLDPSMMVQEPARPDPAPPKPVAPATALIAPEAAASATTSVNALMQALVSERATATHRGGPTIEDLVREEVRPLLKAWLDTHLPPLVERLVRIEIERVVGRAAP